MIAPDFLNLDFAHWHNFRQRNIFIFEAVNHIDNVLAPIIFLRIRIIIVEALIFRQLHHHSMVALRRSGTFTLPANNPIIIITIINVFFARIVNADEAIIFIQVEMHVQLGLTCQLIAVYMHIVMHVVVTVFVHNLLRIVNCILLSVFILTEVVGIINSVPEGAIIEIENIRTLARLIGSLRLNDFERLEVLVLTRIFQFGQELFVRPQNVIFVLRSHGGDVRAFTPDFPVILFNLDFFTHFVEVMVQVPNVVKVIGEPDCPQG